MSTDLPQSRTINYMLTYYRNDGTQVLFDTRGGTALLNNRLNIISSELNTLGNGYRNNSESWLRNTSTNLARAEIKMVHQVQIPDGAVASNGQTGGFINIEDNANFLVIDMIQTVLDYYDITNPEVNQFNLSVADRV